ncbi:CvpA family protein [Candidatus Pseudothioglobus singularis]|nr:CvpA family protein [Candidatus Pseudothioglobus singularis]
MGNFFDNVWSAISILAWSDWLTLFILITFVVRGFIQGLAKEVISFIFVIIAIILAWLYYEPFAKTFLSSWINSDNQSTYALSFGGLFLSAWFIKKGLYRIASASASNQNSNDLNRPFANSVIFVIVGIFSFNFLGTVSNLKTIEAIITNESLRSFVSFVLIFVILMVGLFALSKLLNIKVDTENPSIMAPVYEGILSALSSLDTLINARNVDGLKNKFFGAILGLFIGGTFVLIVVLILQNMSWVTQNHAWVETSGALRTFQDWSVDVKPVLSKYLLFVELDPGDVVVEFIESEILKD